MKRKITLEFEDYILTYENRKDATFKFKSTSRESIFKHRVLKTGHLFYNFKEFNGYFFLDNYDNFYDTIHKKIYDTDKVYFIGEKNKEAFILFQNQNIIEQKIKEGIEKRKKTQDDEERNKIENDFVEDLINELKNFDIKNFKFKNGEFKNDNIRYIIHDNKYEFFRGEDKVEEGDFYYDYYYEDYYKFIRHGNIKDYFEKIESEYF